VEAKNHYFLDPSSSFFLCWQSDFLGWLEEYQPDTLIVEANPRYLSTPSAVEWMHPRGRPVIGWGLGSPTTSGGFASIRLRRRLTFLKKFDALIAYSQRGAREYAQLGIPEARIFTAMNAVRPKPKHPIPARLAAFSDRPMVLFVGRLQQRKRVDLLLKACSGLEIQPRLVIAGDGPERLKLEALAKEDFPSTEFVGPKRGVELKPYFMEADLFVLPGTGGLAVQEAMGYGLPVIVAQRQCRMISYVGQQLWCPDLPALVKPLSCPFRCRSLRRMGANPTSFEEILHQRRRFHHG
jgi:glycosyltransferase involved in cell wall biosynthesis